MPNASRLAIAAVVVGVALLSSGRQSTAQGPTDTLSVSVGYAIPVSELRRWDAAVDRMVRTGELVVTSRRGDGAPTERSHETSRPARGRNTYARRRRIAAARSRRDGVAARHAPSQRRGGGGAGAVASRGRRGHRRRDRRGACRFAAAGHPAMARRLVLARVQRRRGGRRLHLADAVRGGFVATFDALAPAVLPRADAGAAAGRPTDFGAGARLGPRRFTDCGPRLHLRDRLLAGTGPGRVAVASGPGRRQALRPGLAPGASHGLRPVRRLPRSGRRLPHRHGRRGPAPRIASSSGRSSTARSPSFCPRQSRSPWRPRPSASPRPTSRPIPWPNGRSSRRSRRWAAAAPHGRGRRCRRASRRRGR